MHIALNSLRTFVFRVLTVGSLLGITVLTARALGEAGRGVYTLVVLVSTVATTGLSGLGSAIAYQVSNEGRDLRAVIGNALAIGTLVGGGLFLLSVLIWMLPPAHGAWWLPIAGAAQPVLFATTALVWAFLAVDDNRNYSYSLLAPSLAILGFLLLFLAVFPHTAETAVVAWLCGQAVTLLWVLSRGWSSWTPVPWRAVRWSAMTGLGLFGLTSGVANLVSFFNYRADVFLTAAYLGDAKTGVYSVAVQTGEGLWFISSAVGVAIYAHVGMRTKEEAAELTARAMRYSLAIIGMLGLALVLLANPLIPWLYGGAYRGAVPVFRVFIPGIAIFGLGTLFSTFYTNQLGRPRVPLLIAAVSLAINVLVCLVLIPTIGLSGGAWASTLSYGVSMALALTLFRRETGLPWRRFLVLTGYDVRQAMALARRVAGGMAGARGGDVPTT